GEGLLFFNAYGDIHEVEVDGSYIVDNGHAVAWEPTLDYQITRGRSIRSFLFSDQLLLEFHGHGKVWVQSRNPQTLANWVYPFRPQKSKNDND
ncbi:MAG: AIM24 family protein, partial [SAR202 cluster bacterium]|nr:AIM24 family protein [SAR202 cluster bacterium]